MDSPKYELLTQGLNQVMEGRPEEARQTLASLRNRLDVDGSPEDMQYLIFAAAVSRRLFSSKPTDEFNLYLRRYEQTQINLFSLLASRLPLVPMAGAIANGLIQELVRGKETFTLLDVGIGVGRQEVALLEAMAEAKTLPRKLTIVGVEPGDSSLRDAQQALDSTAQRLGVELRFIGIAHSAEALSEEHWAMLESLPGPRVVNAAFAMHHIAWRPEGEDLRDTFFRRLRAWAPAGVVLCEPNSNHHRASLPERFKNCWRHLYFTFQLLEELDISRHEKNSIKDFFSREVEDIVSTVDEQQRSERHEHVSAWLDRLSRCGFQLKEKRGRVWPSTHPAISVCSERGYVGLEYRGETIVAVICATTPDASS